MDDRRANPYTTQTHRRSRAKKTVFLFLLVLLALLVLSENLWAALWHAVLVSTAIQIVAVLARKGRGALAAFGGFLLGVVLTGYLFKTVPSLSAESALPSADAERAGGHHSLDSAVSMNWDLSGQGGFCSILCDFDDPDFDGFRFETIPHCRRNVSQNRKNRMKRLAGIPRNAWGNYEIDHIIPLVLGGSNCPANLQVLMKRHSRQKASYEQKLVKKLKAGRIRHATAVTNLLRWQPDEF